MTKGKIMNNTRLKFSPQDSSAVSTLFLSAANILRMLKKYKTNVKKQQYNSFIIIEEIKGSSFTEVKKNKKSFVILVVAVNLAVT